MRRVLSAAEHTLCAHLLVAISTLAVGSIGALIVVDSGAVEQSRARYPSLNKLTPGIFLEHERAIAPPRSTVRKVDDKGLELTKDSEGFVPDLYNDAAGYCSIAFGHLVKRAGCDGSEPKEYQNGLSKARGTELLIGDMATAQVTVMTAVTSDLSDGEYASLCDFVYNVGSVHFRESTLLKVVNAQQFDRVPNQFRRWVLAGGRTWDGLRTRREREIALFFEGLSKPRALPPAGENLSPIDIQVGEP